MSKKNGILHFPNHQVAKEGDIAVDDVAIDKAIEEPFALIKMDIEGGEYEALEGASNTLKKYKPKLMICVYHKPTDYRAIPLLIKDINSEYSEFYMRYLPLEFNGDVGFCEVVLFAR